MIAKKSYSIPFIIWIIAGTIIPLASIAYYGFTDREVGALIRKEFVKETNELIDLRKIKSNWQLVTILGEQNDKWNALAKIFKNNLGSSPINKNEFRRRIVPEEWPSVKEPAGDCGNDI